MGKLSAIYVERSKLYRWNAVSLRSQDRSARSIAQDAKRREITDSLTRPLENHIICIDAC